GRRAACEERRSYLALGSCGRGGRGGRPARVVRGQLGPGLTCLVERQKVVARRVAQRIEKTPASARVTPAFGIHAFGVAAHIQKFCPRLIVELRGLLGPSEVRLTPIGEFDFRAFTAVGTDNEQHGALSEPRRLPRPRRSGTRRGSAQ